MSKCIEGVPESISRADYVRLIESAGFDPESLLELRFGIDGIYAKVEARDKDGGIIFAPVPGDEFNTVCHEVFIAIADEP